jgi:hypothetical protein
VGADSVIVLKEGGREEGREGGREENFTFWIVFDSWGEVRPPKKREEGREGKREGGREGGREGEEEGRREGGKEGGRETFKPRPAASTGTLKTPLLEGWLIRRVRRGRT